MASALKPHNIYGACKTHQVQMVFIEKNKWGRAIVQCPICFEKRIVPVSWVNGLEPRGGYFGLSSEERFQKSEKERIDNLGYKRNGVGRIG